MNPVRPLFDPQAVPVVAIDAHLPALGAAQLDAAALRTHFATRALRAPELPGDGARFHPDQALRAAAVLVPLVVRAEGLQLLLTRRTERLRHHAGQISFPGGGVEAGDANTWDTAQREAQEEIGLPAERLERLAALPDYSTVTGFSVTPWLALVHPPLRLQLQPEEVTEAFEVPLLQLMDPARHRWHEVEVGGSRRRFLSMPWRNYFIWGATAAMLRNLYHQLDEVSHL